jgi:DNA repair protein RadC
MQTETTTLRELTVRYSVRKDSDDQPVVVGRTISVPTDAAAAFMAVLRDEPSEVFAILCLTTKHRVIAYHEVSRGTLDSTLVHPREVFKAALLANSAAIVISHNHPSSGDPTPSADDVDLTRRLAAAGELLGISLLDHIVIGDGRYFSFKEAGRL